MIVITRDTPQVFGGKTFLLTKQETAAMNTVADAITDNRSPLTKLLLAHDVQVSENASKEELLDAFTNAFKTNNQFSEAFAKKFAAKYSSYDDETQTQNTSTGGADPYTNATVSIVNGIKNILGLFSKPDTTGAQLNYNQQILMLAAQKEAARKRNNTIAIIAVIVVVALIAFGTVYYAKKKKAI